MSATERKRELVKQLAKKQKIGMHFARALGKRRRSLKDKLLLKVAERMVPAGDPAKDFMRDEICDAEPEFSLEELKAFQGRRDQS